jgi:cob(I)alamin adenosyltransferase
VERAERGWEIAEEALLSGEYGMVILDELNTAVSYGLLPIGGVIGALRRRPPEVHVVITGRDAHPRLVEMADLVTEMTEIKHPYGGGAPARKGIEF